MQNNLQDCYTLANLHQSTYFNLFYHSTSYSHDAAGPQTLGARAAWALDVENLIAIIAWVNSHSRTPKIRSAPPRGGGEQGGSSPQNPPPPHLREKYPKKNSRLRRDFYTHFLVNLAIFSMFLTSETVILALVSIFFAPAAHFSPERVRLTNWNPCQKHLVHCRERDSRLRIKHDQVSAL